MLAQNPILVFSRRFLLESSDPFKAFFGFSELLKTLGVPLQVDDLYSLDAESLVLMQPIHALIFLFKWVAGMDESGGAEGTYDDEFPGFFAHQV